jgi:hypothetical protein
MRFTDSSTWGLRNHGLVSPETYHTRPVPFASFRRRWDYRPNDEIPGPEILNSAAHSPFYSFHCAAAPVIGFEKYLAGPMNDALVGPVLGSLGAMFAKFKSLDLTVV